MPGESGIEGHPESEPDWNGQHPLAHGHVGHDMVAKVRREVAHPAPEA
jgi:hypothetical protein